LWAGSADTNLKLLETKAINAAVGSAASVLDAGCGNGHTLVQLSRMNRDTIFFGFDYSAGMVSAARELIEKNGLSTRVKVCKGDIHKLPIEELASIGAPTKGFECIYTERSLINLDSLDQQISAIYALWSLVASGGRLVLCESFVDGLNEINRFRSSVDLPLIQQPWHNRYLSLSELENILTDAIGGREVREFSGTYYFVSRIINARMAMLEGLEPTYDSKVNIQSLEVDPLPVCGQSKIVIFKKP
jgi:SAM-dependent methyltransferase